MSRRILALVLAMMAGAASAQLTDADPDWKELEAPPPPALRTDRLIPVEMPPSNNLRFGVDAGSITVGTDGIVRYVVVAQSPSGTVNAMYEGVRCSSGEVKVYARHNPDSGWVRAANAEWVPLRIARNSRHSLVIARGGACVDAAPNQSAALVVRDLRGAGPDRRALPN